MATTPSAQHAQIDNTLRDFRNGLPGAAETLTALVAADGRYIAGRLVSGLLQAIYYQQNPLVHRDIMRLAKLDADEDRRFLLFEEACVFPTVLREALGRTAALPADTRQTLAAAADGALAALSREELGNVWLSADTPDWLGARAESFYKNFPIGSSRRHGRHGQGLF
ncbi:hypothetical protein NO2_0687 [Candidatus Termititenax persephonae]|uniref:Uncharacterized protein n=1 Tax=Candidatus Termititenax persephonae TaxID=2218525 RepID=A0A388TGS4_9BACT|nr:hypothetical protein NO2_0687 [Candidatus Termititenax persephonae]